MWEYKVLEEVWCIENVLNEMSEAGWTLEQILEQGSRGRTIVFKRLKPIENPAFYGVSPLLPFLEEFAAQAAFEEDQEMLKELGLD